MKYEKIDKLFGHFRKKYFCEKFHFWEMCIMYKKQKIVDNE